MRHAVTRPLAALGALIALGSAVPALAQDPAARSAEDLTRSLNSGPPYPSATPAPAPASQPPVQLAPQPRPPVSAPPPAAQQPRPVAPAYVPPAPAPQLQPQPRPVAPTPAPQPQPQPQPQPRPAPLVAAPAPAPPAGPAVAAPAGEAPSYRALSAAEVQGLPFSIDLPSGFEIGMGRPGPDFTIFSVRRGPTSLVMIYAGPASQFPIYDGEVVQATGRATVVVTEEGQRRALEHLFQRDGAPREVHVWVTSVSGPDRILAERIAQSIDRR